MNQWPNVKLRVVEGWDEHRKYHSASSLHYEGRAVDIMTSDRQESKNGMLARLAVEAGFDWVHYESRHHVHCSVKSEKARIMKNNGCFHGSSLVQTPAGKVEMSKLQVNDMVLTMNPSTGTFQYSPVILWLDKDRNGPDLFVEIQTKSNKTIRLTSSHLIYTFDDLNEQQQKQLLKMPNKDYHANSKGNLNTKTNIDVPDESKTRNSSLKKARSSKVDARIDQEFSTIFDGEIKEKPSDIRSTYYYRYLFESAKIGLLNGFKTLISYTDSEVDDDNTIGGRSTTKMTNKISNLEDAAYVTYARNAVVGQYLLVRDDSRDDQSSSSDTQVLSIQKITRQNNDEKQYSPYLSRDDAIDSSMYLTSDEQNGDKLRYDLIELSSSDNNNQENNFTDDTSRANRLERSSRIGFGYGGKPSNFMSKISVVSNKEPEHFKYDRIVSISYKSMKGIYAPLTREGNLVVDSVVSSCYAMVSDNDMAHMAFAPIRWFSHLNEWIFGLEPETPLRFRTVEAISKFGLNKTERKSEMNGSTLIGQNSHLLSQPKDNSPQSKQINMKGMITTEKSPQSEPISQQHQPSDGRQIHWYAIMLFKIAKFILPTRYFY